MSSDEIIFSFNEEQLKKYLGLKKSRCAPNVQYLVKELTLPVYDTKVAELKQYFKKITEIISRLTADKTADSFFSYDTDKSFRKEALSDFFEAVKMINTVILSAASHLSGLLNVLNIYTERHIVYLRQYNNFLPYYAAFSDCKDMKNVKDSLESFEKDLNTKTEHLTCIINSSRNVCENIIPRFFQNGERALGVNSHENFSYKKFTFICQSTLEQIKSEIIRFDE